MIRQGRSALRTTVIPVLLVRFKMDQTKAGNGNFLGVLQKMATAGKGLSVPPAGSGQDVLPGEIDPKVLYVT